LDQSSGDSSTLALFDFDGTLVDLVTDYAGLRRELDALDITLRDAGLLPRLLKLYATPDQVERASAAVDTAEISGLRAGRSVSRGVDLYEQFVEAGATIAVVTHNGRAVVDAFFAGATLASPNAVFDLRTLQAPKQESRVIRDYVNRLRPSRSYVVGNSDSDRALAKALSAEYLDVNDA
jgi:phosphoglycolate phosphatase-like HAD superfamily hydrolase